MKRILFLLLIACTALGDERTEKRQLVSELLEVLDAKAMVQTSFEQFMTTLGMTIRDKEPEDLPVEERAAWEEERKKEAQQLRDFRERVFAQVDYAKYFEEAYVPLFEERFTTAELRQLIEFFRTSHGQKLAAIVPRLGLGAEAGAMTVIEEAIEASRAQMAMEEAAKNPWKHTVSDLRSLATALESRATDTDEYPNVPFDQLETMLAPTYIREVPKVDAWGTPYLYVADGQHYRFVSAGADRTFEWTSRKLDLAKTEMEFFEDLDVDIIFQDGVFLQSPSER